jgi:hypothetical protein
MLCTSKPSARLDSYTPQLERVSTKPRYMTTDHSLLLRVLKGESISEEQVHARNILSEFISEVPQ